MSVFSCNFETVRLWTREKLTKFLLAANDAVSFSIWHGGSKHSMECLLSSLLLLIQM